MGIVESVRLPDLVDFSGIGGVGSDPTSSFIDVDFSKVPINQLYRYTLNVEDGSTTETMVDKRVCEFPHINPLYFGRKHRFTYVGASAHSEYNQPLQAWLKIDMETGE